MPRRRRRGYRDHGFASHDEYLEAVWRGRLADLRAFQRRFGHTRIPHRWSEDRPLERWVRHQRELYRIGDLRQDRHAELAKLGFEFERAAPVQVPWDQRFRELAAFRRRFGHGRVPRRWTENPALGNWVTTQRGLQARGVLRPDRRRRLEAIGFTWRRKELLPWETMYEKLRAFRRAHGHADVSVRSGDARLLHWVDRQRKLFHAGRLPAERRAKLKKLGFRFRILHPRRSFDERLAELRALRRGSGRRANYGRGDRSLATWIANLRRRPGRLRAEQRAALEKLGVSFAVRADLWESQLARLLQFRNRHGHVHVPSTFRADRALARWVVKQRVRYREGTLEPRRLRRLQALGLFETVDRWEEQG